MPTISVQFPLERGERLLWSGKPRQGIMVVPADAFIIPFSLVWAGFAVLWGLNALRTGAPLGFQLFGAFFVAAGLHFVFGRFLIDARRRSHTDYAITTEQVFVRSGILSPSVRSLSLATLSNIALIEYRNGSGTITFGPTDPLSSMFGRSSWPGVPRGPAFEAIANARDVYNIIREAQAASGAAQPPSTSNPRSGRLV